MLFALLGGLNLTLSQKVYKFIPKLYTFTFHGLVCITIQCVYHYKAKQFCSILRRDGQIRNCQLISSLHMSTKKKCFDPPPPQKCAISHMDQFLDYKIDLQNIFLASLIYISTMFLRKIDDRLFEGHFYDFYWA